MKNNNHNILFEEKRDIIMDILSNTHFEFYKKITKIDKVLKQYFDLPSTYFKVNLNDKNKSTIKVCKKYKVLCANGDICNIKQLAHFFNIVSPEYDYVFFIPGNHEYYDNDFDKVNNQMAELESSYDNVIIFTPIEPRVFFYDDLIFHGTTLWFYCNDPIFCPHNKLNDFKYISINNRSLSYEDTNLFYNISIEELKKTLSFNIPTIVMTHHQPSLECGNINYDGNYCGFVTNTEELIKNPILAWIYGHSYMNVITYLNNVLLCSNQWGYEGNITKSSLFISLNK